jgi:hypothetical protein
MAGTARSGVRLLKTVVIGDNRPQHFTLDQLFAISQASETAVFFISYYLGNQEISKRDALSRFAEQSAPDCVSGFVLREEGA